MLFALNFLFLFPLLTMSVFIPNHIWNSRELANYDTCYRIFGRQHALDPSKVFKDIPISDISHLKGGSPILTWPNGRVPYVLSSNFDSYDSFKRMACGMLFFHTKTCVHFVPKTRNDRSHVFIDHKEKGCFSNSLGMVPNDYQRVGFHPNCWNHATIIHELMHAIGFNHEHSRDDRDQYITVNWHNIAEDGHWQYYTSRQQGHIAKLIGKYDYGSIMHYNRGGDYGNAIEAVKEPNTNNRKMDMEKYGPTEEDLWKINALYSCSGRPRTTSRPRPIKTTPPPQACYDKDTSMCYRWKSYCKQNNQYMIKNCRRTCGLCSYSKPTSDCSDASPNCHWHRCYGNTYQDYWCKKSCAHC